MVFDWKKLVGNDKKPLFANSAELLKKFSLAFPGSHMFQNSIRINNIKLAACKWQLFSRTNLDMLDAWIRIANALTIT